MGLGLHRFLPYALYLVFIGGALIAMIKPTFAVYLLALTLPLQHARYHLSDFPLGGHLMDILLIFAAVGVVIQGGSMVRKSPLLYPVLGTIMISYVSLWVGVLLMPALPLPLQLGNTPFGNWTIFVKLPILFLLVCGTITTKKQMQIALVCMLIAFLWVGKNFYRNMEGRDTGEDFSYDLRTTGADFGGSNGKATYQLEGTLCLIAILGTLRKLWKLLALLAIGLGGYGVLFAYSRGAYLALLVCLLYLGIFKFRLLVPLVIGLVIMAPVVLPKSVWERIQMTYQGGQLDASSEQRLPVWEDAIETAQRDPVLGVGFNCFRFYRAGQRLLDTHNMYLKAYVETGMLGLGCLLILWWRMFWAGHGLFHTATDPFLRALGLGFAAAAIAVIVVNVTGDRWTYIDLSSNTWILAGLVVQAKALQGAASDESELQQEHEVPQSTVQGNPATPMPLRVLIGSPQARPLSLTTSFPLVRPA